MDISEYAFKRLSTEKKYQTIAQPFVLNIELLFPETKKFKYSMKFFSAV